MKRKLFLSFLILSVLLGLILITQTYNRAVAAGPLCYVDDTALGTNDGSSWADAFTDLQSALTDIGCTRIEVAQGIYAPTTAPDRTATFQLRSGVEIYGGYPDGGGTRDPGTYATILSGHIVMGPGTAPPEPYYSYHVVTGSGTDASAVLDGFTIQDGMAMGPSGVDLYGGGMLLSSSSPTLQNLVIRDNSARTSGGGMFIDNSSPTMTNVAFRNNTTAETSSTGGGLSIQGLSSPQLTQVEFTGNISRYGGGMVCSGSPSVQLSDATFQGNSASWGGGVHLTNCGMSLMDVTFENNTVDESGGGMFTSDTFLYSPTLTRVTFTGNSAWEGGGLYSEWGYISLTNVFLSSNWADAGGGFFIGYLGSATIHDTQFVSNTSVGNGGGLYVEGSVNMVDSLLEQNTASTGGGLALSSPSLVTFTNLIVSANTATGSGGGIYAYAGPAPIFTNLLLVGNSAAYGGGMANYNFMDPEIVNATIYGNQASDSGSAIYNYQSSPSLTNVIVWGNTETITGPDIVNSGPASLPSIAASILEEGCPSGATCSGIITGDPLFVDAANDNLRLQAASPAIDAGNNGALPVEVTTDLDARPRFVDVPGVPDIGIGTPPIVDMGPYEAHYESNLIIYVDQDAPGPIQDGSSWATAYTGLQNGLAVAVEGDQIWVADGVYYPGSPGAARTVTFQLKNGVALYGGFAGMEGSLGERDWAAHPTTLSGDLDGNGVLDDGNAYHVITGSGVDSSVVLDGFIIQDGMANGGATNGLGGGVYIDAGSPFLQNLVIQGNSALESGGGMYLFDSNPALINVAFRNNEASMSGSWGGGLSVYGTSFPAMSQIEFTDNSAWNGGGMYCEGAWNIQLTESTFQGNVAYQGGGLNLDYCGIDLANVTFGSNIAYGLGGGGMYTLNGTGGFSPTLSWVSFINNYSDSSGGGLYSYSGDLILYDVTFAGNQANDAGGGLFIDDLISGVFTDLTVTDNQVNLGTGSGGGIYLYAAEPFITNLLLTGNSAAYGGGMTNGLISSPYIVNSTIYGNLAGVAGSAFYNDQGSLNLHNVIVWGNTETVPGPDIADSGVASAIISTTLLEDGVCPVNATCTSLIFGDPQFSNPANNDFSLLASSPAVDAGNAAALPLDENDEDGDGDMSEWFPYDLIGNRRIVLERVDLGAYEAQLWNINWTEAAPLPLVEGLPNVQSIEIDRYLDRMGQSRWFTFSVKPDSKVIVTLTGLPANYDLTLYKDIAQAYDELNSPQDLVQLSAEFAPDTFSPDTFSPDTFSPDTFSPDTFSPDTFSPDTFSPDTFSPDTFSPDTYSPDTFSPDTFSPDTYSPDTFSPDTFSPDTFSPDTFSPDTYSPDTFSPDTFSSAQTRSLIAVSAYEGTLGEGIMINTWTRSGDFYLRVRGRNGAYSPDAPFHLQVIHLSGVCNPVSPLLPASNTQLPDGEYETLILTNLGKTAGSPGEIATLQANLAALAAETNGWVVDVGTDNRVSAAAQQAESNPACVYAKNLEAYAVKEIVDGFRALNPLEYIVLVGNDRAIPFFRYRDNSLLASEMGYSPPVMDNTTSQASLKSGYILTQDTYAAGIELSTKAYELPLPDLAIGRLVETASDINQVLAAYLATGGVVYPTNALVTGYDFLEDAANAVRDELQAGLGATAVDTLIMSNTLSPEDPLAWTATDLQNSFLGSDHDLVFLAGHFSASSTLAADYDTRLRTSDVLASAIDFTGDLIYSAGCHSGYNIVNAHDVPNVTDEPDWAQAFAAKGATFIGGTGYQYGDTEFIEYSERLYLEFTRQLRYGSGPVAVGKALAQAKQAYLANTPVMRGIHEKSLLEATLFGLPMLQVALPYQTTAPLDPSIVAGTSGFATNPGLTLGLEYANLHLASTVTETTITLDVISQSGGDPTQVIASYLEGPDGVVVNAAEPVLPLDMLNVTHPVSSSFVLRGIGWRGGDYTDLPDRLPLTGAATQDLRAPHPAFFSDIFYPVRPWNVNYFDALSNSGGPTRLAWMPAQYRSSSPGSLTGTLRQFDTADFRLFYSSNYSSYSSTDPNWINVPALSAPPDISRIMSTINPDGTLSFDVTVVGDPAAGIQEVWIVYTGESGSLYGVWFPLDLVQDPVDTRLWRGTLSTVDTPLVDLRFVVQAVNGVGLVTMMTNEGAYYRAGVEPGAPPLGETPVTLVLDTPPASGEFGGQASFTAVLTTLDGTGQTAPLAAIPVAFHLGGQARMAVTGSDGRATASFFLLAVPDEYALTAAFNGNDTYASASDSSYFEVLPGTSSLSLAPAASEIFFGTSTQFTVTLTSGGLPLSLKPVALTLVDGAGATTYTAVSTTDYAGQTRLDVPAQPLGSYTVTAWFGLPVSSDLDLSTPYYTGSTIDATLVVVPYTFSGFYPPVDNPPVLNKVKAGSAVPVKFSLGGDFGLDIIAGGYPASTLSNCEPGDTNPVEETVSAGESALTYDPLTDQYTYVWKTDKQWAGTCQTLVLQFVDGTEVYALFQFTK